MAVIHLGPYRLEPVSLASCDHAIVALDFSHGNQLEDLWQILPQSKNTDWSLFNVKDKLYRLDESASYFKMEQVTDQGLVIESPLNGLFRNLVNVILT